MRDFFNIVKYVQLRPFFTTLAQETSIRYDFVDPFQPQTTFKDGASLLVRTLQFCAINYATTESKIFLL